MSKKHLLIVAILTGLLITIASALYTSSQLIITRPVLTSTTSLPQDTSCLDVVGAKKSGGAPIVFMQSTKINSCQTVTTVYVLSFVLNWVFYTLLLVALGMMYSFVIKIARK